MSDERSTDSMPQQPPRSDQPDPGKADDSGRTDGRRQRQADKADDRPAAAASDAQDQSTAPTATDGRSQAGAPDKAAQDTAAGTRGSRGAGRRRDTATVPAETADAPTAASEGTAANTGPADPGAATDADADVDAVRFDEFGLAPDLLKAINALGFTKCTPIQAQTLPHSLANYDVTGQAQTGTGKTAAFLITLISHQLEHIPERPNPPGTPRALVIAPTRELVMQIADDARDLTRYCGLNVLTVVGGMDFEKQRRVLENEVVDILVATPGRLLDFITRGKLNLRHVEQLVLDEADRMLSMGFIPDVRRIIRQTPPKRLRQTLLFSATYNDDVLRLAHQWTLAAEHVVIEPESVAVDSVEQKVFLVSAEDKFPLLYNLMNDLALDRVIVFANRRDVTRDIFERLKHLDIACEMLSGEVPQQRRVRTLEQFKDGKIRVLAATDVAGRGLHVDGISHVINYDLPEDPEDYVHRIGRTGRAGAKGISISFLGEDDAFLLPQIEALLGTKLDCTQPEAELLEPPDEPARASSGASGGPRRGGARRRPGGGGNRPRGRSRD